LKPWTRVHYAAIIDNRLLPAFEASTRREVVAEGHTGPWWWDGSDEALPDGIDAVIEQIFARVRAGEPVNTVCALAAETPREGRARGLAVQLLKAMCTIDAGA
jgi:hypothetical protein